jgi:selenocysteine lyase/cysteine desulfurase
MSDSSPMNLSHHHYIPGPSAKRFQASLGPSSYLLAVAVNFLLDIGIDNIFKHLLNLTDVIIDFVHDNPKFIMNSPVDDVKHRSGIINFSCPNAEAIVARLRKLEKPIAVSYREKGIRVSPHCYNTEEEVQTSLEIIKELSSS